jgi:hypothetical protein
LCLLSLVPGRLTDASTWKQRNIILADRCVRYNYESLLAFATIALCIIGITVTWTGYRKRDRTAWFIMLMFLCVFFVPVYLVDVFLDIKRVGWHWWAGVVQDAMEGRPFAQAAIRVLVTFALIVIALLVPIGAFFGKSKVGCNDDKPKTDSGGR